MNERLAVVYFDDTQIIGCVVEQGCGQAFKTIASVQRDYSGIVDSVFADREDFVATMAAVLRELAQTVRHMPEILHVAVANQFIQVETQQSELKFDRMTKIKPHHLRLLWENTQFNEVNRGIIAKEALYFELAEYENAMLDVLGLSTTKIQMVASAASISNEFRFLINASAIKSVGFVEIRFVPLAACELFMIPEKHRDEGCTLIRCDFFSTSVANVLGDGLTHLSHFNVGLGYLVGEVAENFSITYEAAIELLQNCTPTLEMPLDESYTARGQSIPAGIFNEFVMKRINDFGNRLADLDTARLVYLSGGNYDRIYGVKNVLANICDRTIYQCQDVLTGHTDYPENTINAIVRYIFNHHY